MFSMAQIKTMIDLTRPFTLVAPVIATVFGIAMSLISHGESQKLIQYWYVVIIAAIVMALAQMCGQIFNQTEDPIELDIINNKGYRPLQQGRITQKKARVIGLITGCMALVGAFIINYSFGIGMVLILFFALFYSLKPIRAKKLIIIGTLWLAVSRGILPLMIVWSIFYTPFENLPIILSTVLFFWVFGFQITKDVPDIKGDQQFGILTFPVVYGLKNTKKIMHLMNGLAILILIGSIFMSLLHPAFSLAMFIFIVSVFVINRIGKSHHRKRFIENSFAWVFFYLGLGSLYILFTISMILS